MPEVSKRTPANLRPSLRATCKVVPTQSLSKSTRAIRAISGATYLSKALVAASVSPLYAAIRAWGIVPRPLPLLAKALASVEKP